MRVYEIGVIRNGEILITKKYYGEPKDKIDEEWTTLLEELLLSMINENAKYDNKIYSFEILKYCISIMGKKNGEKSKFISYLITDKNSSMDTISPLLRKCFQEFFKRFTPPKCYNVNKNTFNSFTKVLDGIVGDLSLEPSERLEAALLGSK